VNRWILVIADDLTGALEVGAKFSGRGLNALVTTSLVLDRAPGVPVLVIDTETRHLGESEAASVVRGVALAARRYSPWLIYKKTDSTLRGNIAAELRVLQEIFVERDLIYAPAYPEMGRTVVKGKLFIWGTPVHESAFAVDPLNPIRDSDLAAILNGLPAVVLDGESIADIEAAARTVTMAEVPPVVAGPAGLAGAVAECLVPKHKETGSLPRLPRCLVVNGSMHPSSVAQIAFARKHGCFDDDWRCFEQPGKGSGLDRAHHTGEAVGRLLQSSPMDAIVVFGGDTAIGIHQAIGSPDFEPCCEIAPGIPLSCCGGLFWITKAGGFGEPDILCDLRGKLT
jgi:uncharacterized protein YgbK (DUF1537 family)